ncbi:MAG: PAS domain S-box protein [Proteobacteria bacterium]|nr:PAS domain S-box protein [Pseudomonadota bacterium]
MSLQYLLEQQGYSVVVCENGRKALEAAKRRKPTLVISDIVMPELDGYGLCRALKADSDLAEVPVLLVTTLNDPEDVLRGLDAGADSFILKPYDDPFLLNRVRFVLLHRQLRRTDRTDMGVEISFKGRTHFITSDRLQILNLLLSTYEAAIHRNEELRRSEDELRQANAALSNANARLEEQVGQRERAEEQVRRLSSDLLKASEAQLQHSEQRFRQLLDVVPAAIYASDANGRILEYNPAAVALWGRHPEPGVTGEAFYEACRLQRPDGAPLEGLDAMTLTLETGEPVRNAELALRRPDGSRVEVLVNTASIRDAEGRPAGSINCLLEVTDLSQAQRQLSAGRQLAQGTLDALSAHICVLDQTGTIIAVNEAWRRFGLHNGAAEAAVGEGTNYLEVCAQVLGCEREQAEQFAQGLREFMNQRRDEFHMEYSCHSPQEQRWFVARVTRFAIDHTVRFVIAHENITERKLAEEQLREKNGLLKMAGDMARIGGWAYRLEDQTLIWSDEVAAIHEVPPGTSPDVAQAIEFYAPEHRDRLAARFKACVEQGVPYDEESEIISATGRRIWVRSIGVAVTNAEGNVVRAQGAFQDISARKHEEERVSRIAERLTTTLESITDAFYTVDREWQFTYVNREAERIMQRSREQLLGRGIWEEFPQAVGSEFERQYREAVEQHCAVRFESYYPALDLWVEVQAYPSDEGLAVYFRDVGKRKNAELALRQSEESLRLAVTAGGLGTWNWKTAGNHLQWSDASRHMLGLEADATPAYEDFLAAIHPQDREHVTNALQQAVQDKADFRADFRVVWPDGSIRWIAGMGRAYTECGEDELRMEGVILDITERKRSEHDLLELNEQLEQRVEQRTRELVAATQQAEAANAAKSSFLATMSHEIRTPMNGIVGMVDVIAHSPLSEHQGDAVRTIRESAFTLLHLIDDVLDFSKIEAGKLELERTPVSLADLAEGVCDTLTSVADTKGVDLFLFVSPEGPAQVRGDAVRLRQILYNLVGNAIKFSGGRADKRGRVDLRIEVAREAPLMVRFEVSDNGVGIPQAARAHLFQSFQQAEVSTTRRYGGTGLGLAICKRLVELMGGEIAVDSTPGVETTFTVNLPFEAAPGRRAGGPRPDLTGVNYVLVSGANIRAEDLRVYLECAGASTRVVGSGVEAVKACAELSAPIVVHGGIDEDSRDAWLSLFFNAPDVRHLLISRGRRRVARLAGPKIVTIDGNSMRRRSLLYAAAVAAGRASPASGDCRTPGDIPQLQVIAPTVAEARARGQLILVAEDDTTNQKVLLRQLELLGYAAEVAGDGVEALRLWRGGSYALLLTDLHMPRLDGYGLTSSIRREEAGGRRMPILALTANALRGEASRALAAGLDEYLTKPMQLPVLREVLNKWLPLDVGTGRSADADPLPEPDAQAARRVLDVSMLRGVVGDAPETLRELLADYQQAASQAVANLHAALEADDIKEIGVITHRLKSSSRTVGALPMGDLCAELENASRVADKAGVKRAMGQLAPALAELQASIEQALEEDL